MRAALSRFCLKISKTKPVKTKPVSERGFSVLEAMIAMALLAAAFLPLLALQSQFVTAVDGLERAEARLYTRDMAIARLQSVNLSLKPSGEIITAYGIINWKAEPAIPPRMAKGVGGVESRYEITLFDVTVHITPPENTENLQSKSEEFQLRGLGWRPVRATIDDF